MADFDPDWLEGMPTYDPSQLTSAQPPAPTNNTNFALAGIKTGWNEAVGSLGSAEQAVGTLTGWDGLAGYGKSVADYRAKLAAGTKRQDLEDHPWSPAGIGYQLAKAVPSMAGAVAGSALLAPVLPEAAGLGAVGAAAGSALPRWLVGRGVATAAEIAAGDGGAAAAARAGQTFAKHVIAGAIPMAPQTIGGAADAYKASHGGELTPGGAAGAIGLGLLEAPIAATVPAVARDARFAGPAALRMLKGAGAGAGVAAPQMALQSAMTSMMDPDKSLTDRAHDAVQAALGGALVGGALGGAMAKFSKADPGKLAADTDALDNATAHLDPDAQAAEPPPPPPAAPGAADAMAAAVARGPTPSAESMANTRDLMGAFSDVDESTLRAQANELAEKKNKTDAENLQHALYQDEIGARTPPGADPETATLFTPDEMGKRAVLAKDFKLQIQDDKPHLNLSDDTLKGVTSEAELINKANAELDKAADPANKYKVPADIAAIAKEYELTGKPIEQKIAEQQGQVAQLMTKAAEQKDRNPGVAEKALKDAAAARPELQRLQSIKDLQDQAALLRAKPEADEVAPTESAPADAATTLPEAASATPDAAAAPANNNLPPMPDGLSPRMQDHWNNMSDLSDAMRASGNLEAAQKAEDALTLMKKSADNGDKVLRGTRGDDGAINLANQYQEELAQHREAKTAEPEPAVTEGGVSTDIPPEIAAQLGEAPKPALPSDNPMIRDGSSLQDVVAQSAAKRAAVNDNAPGGDVAPLAPAAVTHPVDYAAEILSNHRVEAQRIAADPNDPDRAAAMAALDRENSGKAKDKNAVADFVNAREARLEAQMPQGPFTGRDSNVIGTASVDPAHVQLVDGMMQAADMPNVRVMVGHSNDVQGALGDAHGLNGSYAPARAAGEYFADPTNVDKNGLTMQFGPNKGDFMIFVRPGLSDAMTASVYAEEVGHIAKKVVYNQATPEVRAAVDKAYLDEMRKVNPDMTGQDLLRLVRSKAQAEDAARKLDPNMKASELPNLGYYTSFDEWLSNQVARWVGTAERPKNAVQRFFASVADRWRNIVAAVFGDEYAPHEAVVNMMNAHNVDASLMWAGDGDGKARFSATTADPAPKSMDEMNAVTATRIRGAQSQLDRVLNNSVSSGAMAATRWTKNFFSGSTLNAKLYEKPAPALRDMVDLNQERGTHADAFTQPGATILASLARFPAPVQEIMGRLNKFVAEGGDYTKPLDQQTQASNPQVAKNYEQAAKDWQTLNKFHGDAAKAMGDLRTLTDAAALANRAAALDKTVQAHTRNGTPVANAPDFLAQLRLNNTAKENPTLWKQTLEQGLEAQRAALQNHLAETQKAAAILDAANPRPVGSVESAAGDVLRARADDITYALAEDDAAAQRAGKAFVPASRHGDYTVSSMMPVDANGNVDPAAAAKLQKTLDDAGFHVSVMNTSRDGNFLIRVENQGLADKLNQLMLDGRGDFLAKDAQVRVGNPADLASVMNVLPKSVRDQINKLHDSIVIPEGASEQVRQAYQTAIDNAKMDDARQWIDKQRDTGQLVGTDNGASTDYWRNFSSYFDAHGRAMATHITSGRMADTIRALGHQVDEFSTNNRDTQSALGLQAAAAEAVLREKMKAWSLPSANFDFITRLQHSVVIGTSPAYVLTLLGQIATLSWPELAKTHGYMGAALALARAAPTAFKVLRSAFDGPHLRITEAGLKEAGVPADLAAKILRADNMGLLTQSTWTHQLNNVVGGGDPRWNTLRDMSSVMGRSAEVLPRILTMLAADDLHAQKSDHLRVGYDDFIKRMVNGSQMEWGSGTSSRAVGRMGMFGAASPLMLNFTGYQSRIIQKYYEEMHALFTGKQDSIRNDSSARVEAAKFLGGHIAATMALAGSMGLPGAGWFAAAADKLGNVITDRDDFDVKAAYRSWLTDTFGPGVGEVMAKGLPRAAGVDMSHEGEQELLPFTRFFEDKHKFSDALKDWGQGMMGSGIGMGANMYAAGHDFYNGDYMLGAQKALPGSLLKGSMQAFRMQQTGVYEDKNGVPLPLTPTAADMLMTAMGLKPTAKAEYDDEQSTISGLEEQRVMRGQDITAHIERAIMHGDTDGLDKWLDESREFGLQHPGLPQPIMSVGAHALKYAKQSATAEATGTHLGQNLKDVNLAEQVRYGNWRNRGMQ